MACKENIRLITRIHVLNLFEVKSLVTTRCNPMGLIINYKVDKIQTVLGQSLNDPPTTTTDRTM